MNNNSKLRLATLVIIGAMASNGCGLLQRNTNQDVPCHAPQIQPFQGNSAGGSWQWVPDCQQQHGHLTSPYVGYCMQCGQDILDVAARCQRAMPPRQYPHSPTPAWQYPTTHAPELTSPLEPTPAPRPAAPTTPRLIPKLDAPNIDDAMDQLPTESHSEQIEEMPGPVEPSHGELPPPKKLPNAAKNTRNQTSPFPILLSPTSMEQPADCGAIYHPMPETSAPLRSADRRGNETYPRTDASGPEEWMRARHQPTTPVSTDARQ